MEQNFVPDAAIPDDGVVTACLMVVAYLDSEGQSCYSVATRGDSPMTSYLGLTLLAQRHLMEWETQ